ncbi:hypothetical protein CI109_106901 [Kwoniella shandongensis]|uniref:Uncharacterized protein n=1 Tax=Kwoniella shandongensis TaxID=1734106 RepID=A0A5M6C6L4_9TREE|nr:uncharacterized protein CI109_000843 [Kwoniella shandongensis]KAA5530663.1 hypothetical protein CI109_000843 [Kwoniella shandongensis]
MLPPPIPSSDTRSARHSSTTSATSATARGASASSSSYPATEGGATRLTARHGEDGSVWLFTPPVLLERGMFRGKEMRFALNVAQEPVLGRRKTDKDRRPLGPAPIVRMRIVECRRRQIESGRRRARSTLAVGEGEGETDWDEDEVDPSLIEPSHLLCAAELGPPSMLPASFDLPTFNLPLSGSTGASANMAAISLDDDPDRDSEGDVHMRSRDSDESTPLASLQRVDVGVAGPGPSTSLHTDKPHDNGLAPPASRRYAEDSSPTPTPRPISRVGSYSGFASDSDEEGEPHSGPSREKRRRPDPSSAGGNGVGRNLFGSLHVAGVKVPAIDGTMGLWFLFTDLSVRQEGRYTLRFRCFDLTALDFENNSPAPQLAHCESQTFKIYSPRQVPPLPKPTELAEHFAKLGFKLNTRKNERTVATPPPAPPPSLPESRTSEIRPDIRPIQPVDPPTSASSASGVEVGGTSATSASVGGGSVSGQSASASAGSTSESVARLSTTSSGSLGGGSGGASASASGSGGASASGGGGGGGLGVGVGGNVSGPMGITPPLTPLEQKRRKEP